MVYWSICYNPVLLIRFEEVGYLSVALAREFPSCYLITSIYKKWLQAEFLVLNYPSWSLNIHLFYNNCSPDCSISDQNLSFADM